VKNFSVSTVATAPVTPTAGTSLTIQSGHGVWFDVGMATVFPAGQMPNPSTGEVIRLGTPTGDTFPIVRAQEGSTNRAIGVGDVIMQGGTAQWIDTNGGAVYNVRSKGALLDDTTNDAAALQATITSCSTFGGGTVLVPGKLFCGNTTVTWPSNVRIQGIGMTSSHIRKGTGTNIMLDHSGTATGAANHVTKGGLRDITIRGTSGGSFGALLRLYYVNNFRADNVHFFINDDKFIDMVETQDSYFQMCTFESGGGSNISAPMVHIRNAMAASGFGSSTDASNMVWFTQCRWEDYEDGALWVEQPAAFSTAPPNGMFLNQVKFETHRVRGIPVIFDGGCSNIHISKADVVMGQFAPAVTTAVPGIQVAAFEHASLRDIRFVGMESSSMSYGIEIYCQDGPTVIDGIGHIGTAPTVAVVQQNGGTGVVKIAAVGSNTAGVTLIGGGPYDVEAITFAATITPAANLRRVKTVTLTGNITVAAPTGAYPGAELLFIFTQDATGGRTVTWNAAFRPNFTPTTTANKVNTVTFVYNGTSWMQTASATNL
jgi:hypothetical protein